MSATVTVRDEKFGMLHTFQVDPVERLKTLALYVEGGYLTEEEAKRVAAGWERLLQKANEARDGA